MYKMLKRKQRWPWEWCLREQGEHFGQDKVTERFLRCLWQDQYLENIPLETVDGHRIKVITPGWWNLEKGPDFSKAVICLDDNIILKGDIEIDLHSNDWKGHGHHQDPAFNGVVLHVVWQKGLKGRKIFNSVGQEIVELELNRVLGSNISQLLESIEPELYPYYCRGGQGHCSSMIQQEDPQKISQVLDLVGDERIVLKALRYEKELIKEGFDQLAYQGIMMALGYKANQKPFLKLAKDLRLDILKKVLKGSSVAEDALRLQGIFLIAGGWIILAGNRVVMRSPEPATSKYLHKIERVWQEVNGFVPQVKPEDVSWRLVGTRPANYPPRRLAGLAYFLTENLPKGIFAQLLYPIETLRKTPLTPGASHYSAIFPAYQQLWGANYADYWLYRFTLGGRPLAKPIKLVGPEKVHQIIINVIIPLALIHARRNREVELEKVLHNIYETAPKAPDNSILRFMTNRIFGGNKERRALIHSARRQQALLHLFYDYCTERGGSCEGCEFLSFITTTTPRAYV